MADIDTAPCPPAHDLHAGFLLLLPRLAAHGRAYFRHVACPQRRDDLAAEAVAIAWAWYCRLALAGKDPHQFAATFVHRALLQARCHRRLCGSHRAKDVLSPLAQARHGFRASCQGSSGQGQPLDALAFDTRTPPPEQAAFRLDFPRWLASLPERQRRVAMDLMAGERALDVARGHGISPARVSQMRAEMRRGWCRFHGEDA